MIEREEIIGCQSWYDLADYHYTGQSDLPEGVIHCDAGSIPECFSVIARRPTRKYIVISARSDFGLHYQQEYPPWRDYGKMADQCIGPQESNFGYSSVTLPPPINPHRCRPNDIYSLRCYRYTEATFSYIPVNVVRWYVANNTVQNERIISIPFGINNVDGCTDGIDKIMARQDRVMQDRPKDLYVNFAFYTMGRYNLFNLYKNDAFATCEQNKTYDEYLDQLLEHEFVLCPPGNGWDCYRTLEALYLGCIPIVEMNTAMNVYVDMRMPVIYMESLEAISLPLILDIYKNSRMIHRNEWNMDRAKLSYWKNLIDKDKGLI